MPFRVLLADDTDIMRKAVVSMLYEESSIEVVGEAANFGQVVQLIADLKPEVLVMDLHLAKMFPAVLVRAQLSTVGRLVAVSFANDSEARMLAQSYGASALLDKLYLYRDLVPAIRNHLGSQELKRATNA
jgi:DNA-binding NarL/FixJ family response regulator